MESTSLKYLGAFFLVVAAQGLFFTTAQLSAKKGNASRIFLSLIVFYFSVSLAESGLWWTGRMDSFVHLMEMSAALPFLFGPLVYLYFRSTAEKEAMMAGEITFRSLFFIYFSSNYTLALKGVSLFAYGILTWKTLYPKAKVLVGVRSWFRLAFGVYVFYTVNFVTFHILEKTNLVGACSDYGIASAMSVFIYLFSWFGFVRPKVFDGYTVNEALRPAVFQKYKSSVLSESLEQELGIKLEGLMRSERLYRDEQVRLDTLAEKLGVSRNSVSQVINKTGMNFFEYINSWRIEEAKKLLSETSKQELNIIEIAYEVGFNNKVSFNKFFKKSTGLTPSEFRKLSLEKRG